MALDQVGLPPSSLKSEWDLPFLGDSGAPPATFFQKPVQKQLFQGLIDSQLAGRDRQRWILWCLGTFVYPPLDPVLIKSQLSRATWPILAVAKPGGISHKLWITFSFTCSPAVGQIWTASDIVLHQLQTTLEQYRKGDHSRQALNSAETSATLFFSRFSLSLSFFFFYSHLRLYSGILLPHELFHC